MQETNEQKAERLKDLMKTVDILKAGHGACLPNGNIVDIREYPNAIPIPPNNPFLKIHPLEAKARAKQEQTKDWIEDFFHENGNYTNICNKCGDEFCGHKRRIVCKSCFSK